MKTKVQYTKYYSKNIIKVVDIPDDVLPEDRENWLLDNELDLFEEEITQQGLDYVDDSVVEIID